MIRKCIKIRKRTAALPRDFNAPAKTIGRYFMDNTGFDIGKKIAKEHKR